MLLMPEDIEKKKQEQAAVQPEAPAQAPPSLLAPVVPQTPWERMQEKHGTGESILRILGTGLSGGILGDVLMPEMTADGQAQYDAEMKAYGTQADAYLASQALAGIDPKNLTPEHIALGTEFGGTAFGEYLTDQYAAQQNSEGGDAAIAEHFDYTPYQWSKLSPEKRRDLSDRYNFEMNGEGAFNYRQYADGSAPEQVQAVKQAESEGTGRGNEITSDRQTVTGIRRQIKGIDEGARMLTDVRDLISTRQADPGKFRAGMRNLFGVETREDGVMSATAAQGVIDQLRDVTLGAISESELKLLLGGLLDPSRSAEANLGTIDTALERMNSNKKLAIDDARLAWGRLDKDESQADFLNQASEDDWYFNNLGEGKNFRAVPKADGSGEVTFSQYSENVRRNFKAQNPYADPPTREDLILGFNEFREQQEKAWTAEQERKKAEAEKLEIATKGLSQVPLMMRAAGGQEQPEQPQTPDYLR